MEQHEETLAAYIDSVRNLPETLRVVLVGSVCRGTERPDPDVDVYRVITDTAFAAADATERLSYSIREISTYDPQRAVAQPLHPGQRARLAEQHAASGVDVAGARIARRGFRDPALVVLECPS
jgi:predicted nucleotidyltransferase